MEQSAISFKEQLSLTRQHFFGGMPQEIVQIFGTHEQEFKESDILLHALKVGDKIPDFTLPNALGKMVNIYKLMTKKWLVISFYRGEWCPFCQLELRNLQRNLTKIENAPSNLVAISPQNPDNSLNTMQKNALTFEVLSDVGSKVGRQFKVIYTVPDYLQKVYEKNGVDGQYLTAENKMFMPAPSIFVVDNQGIIRMRSIETNFTQRIDPLEVVRFMEEN